RRPRLFGLTLGLAAAIGLKASFNCNLEALRGGKSQPAPAITGSQHQRSSHKDQAMDKFTTLEGVAAPLKIINVDTDMIIPKQYLKTIKRTGLGKGLFSEQRYKDDGSE